AFHHQGDSFAEEGGMARVFGMACLLVTMVVAFGSAGPNDEAKKTRKLDPDEFFAKLDENMDGKLSRDEVLKMADRAKDKDKARDSLGKAYDKLDPMKQGITKVKFREFMDSKKKKDDKAKA